MNFDQLNDFWDVLFFAFVSLLILVLFFGSSSFAQDQAEEFPVQTKTIKISDFPGRYRCKVTRISLDIENEFEPAKTVENFNMSIIQISKSFLEFYPFPCQTQPRLFLEVAESELKTVVNDEGPAGLAIVPMVGSPSETGLFFTYILRPAEKEVVVVCGYAVKIQPSKNNFK